MTQDVEAELGARLETAVKTGDQVALAMVAEDIDRYVFDGAAFPSKLFSEVLSLMRSVEFFRLVESVGVVKIFEYNLDLLSDTQGQQLVSALTDMISELTDSVSAFLAVELIAEIWRDARSFDALVSLTRKESANTLALVVHGFDWLAKKTTQEDVRTSCLDQLRRLSKHSSSIVQAEAAAALRKRTGDAHKATS